MIQDIYPHLLDNQFKVNVKPKTDDYVLFFDGQNVLMNTIDNFSFPMVKDFKKEDIGYYLFTIDNHAYYLLNKFDELKEGFKLINLSELRESAILEKHFLMALFTGKHLSDWYHNTKYCGCCGKELTHSKNERAMQCTCGNIVYPRIMPAVIVGVISGEYLLLTKYRTGYRHNALVACFTEIGETLEETVKREVKEEVGLDVKNIRYYSSQPWGSASDILAGFFCDVDGDSNITMDQNELKYAEWTKREDIILQPDDLSLTNHMMKMFKEGYVK